MLRYLLLALVLTTCVMADDEVPHRDGSVSVLVSLSVEDAEAVRLAYEGWRLMRDERDPPATGLPDFVRACVMGQIHHHRKTVEEKAGPGATASEAKAVTDAELARRAAERAAVEAASAQRLRDAVAAELKAIREAEAATAERERLRLLAESEAMEPVEP